MDKNRISELLELASDARRGIVDSVITAGCGHPGGALSCVDVLTALFFEILALDPSNPDWEERDRFILSKGHSSVALYSVMSLRGFFDRETLLTFRQDMSHLGGHPDMLKVPGVEMSTGSLGHGLSVGVGIALANKLDDRQQKVFVLMGDGETQEGSIWEAAMSASHFKLDNLVGIVDRNRIQIDGFTEDIISLEPYEEKWKAFGWEVRTMDGHDMHQILDTLNRVPFSSDKPSLIISNTIKGKGVSFMENNPAWHGGAPRGELAETALRDVDSTMRQP
ncbi:transketolase [Gemmatimonadota bacterium]